MINFLDWKIIFLWEKNFTVNVNWVWYWVFAWNNTISKLDLNKNSQIWIHTNVRETEISLFWFLEKEELDFFEVLIWVNWVWAKTALEILNLSVDWIKSAILSWDVPFLKQIKWIWQKAAERIILELKNKLWDFDLKNLKSNKNLEENEILSDAISWLENLWYKKSEITKVLRNCKKFDWVEDLIKYFLGKQ
jgi:Holliday junction DNA helicase RuvA